MMKADLVRVGISAAVGLCCFLLAFNWHKISQRLPQKSANFLGQAALSAKVWSAITFAVFCYVAYPMVYSRIWLSFVDPQQLGTPSATIQFNDGGGEFEILKSNNISAMVANILTQKIIPGECRKPDLQLYGSSSLFDKQEVCTPATSEDVLKTSIYLSAKHEFKFGSVNINSHGAKIPKFKISTHERQAVIVFDRQLQNVVVDVALEPLQ